MALACDIIVASSCARFSFPESKLGLVPGAGGIFRILQQIPRRTAMGYLLTGRSLGAQRAFGLGLVNEVVKLENLDQSVDRWLHDLLQAAPLSLNSILETAEESSNMNLEQAFEKEYVWESVRQNSLDAIEGPAAFADRRNPIWRGF